MTEKHSFPITKTWGYSTYIRLRLRLDRYPSPGDLYWAENALDEWLKKCADGYYGKPYTVLSRQFYTKYHTSEIELRFDIVNAPDIIIDRLLSLIDLKFVKPQTTADIKLAVIGYYNIL